MELAVDPLVATVIPIIVLILRRFIPTVADSPYWSLGLAVALGALTAGAGALDIPLPGGEVTLMQGVASALMGVGGVEVAKLAQPVRKLNKSNTEPRMPKS